jgi:Protein of unknown function (DUF3455)
MAIIADRSPAPDLVSVFRDNLNHTVTVSRDAAGTPFINGGAGSNRVSGQSGGDHIIWNSGDGRDLFSGGTSRTRRENGKENCNTRENRTVRRIWVIACATCLAAAVTVSLPQPARARQVTPPPVPPEIQVPAGNVAFLVGHAVGTQNYICLPSESGFKFVLFTPEATLFDDLDKQIITHFFSPNANPVPPNPSEFGKIRATWQDSKDSSIVWGGTAIPSSDARFVAPDAIAWLLLPMAGVQVGPTGGDTLTITTFIQRLNTSGGVAPSEECTSMNDIGKQKFVDYTADYFFYTDGQKRRAPR